MRQQSKVQLTFQVDLFDFRQKCYNRYFELGKNYRKVWLLQNFCHSMEGRRW